MSRVPDPLERVRAANPVPRAVSVDWTAIQEHIRHDAPDEHTRPAPIGLTRRVSAWTRGRQAVAATVAIGTVAAAALAGVLASSSGSIAGRAFALPVFAKPASDVRPLRTELEVFVRHDADLRDARAITTPYGTGYVTTNADGSEVCAAVPLPPPPPAGDLALAGTCDETTPGDPAGLVMTVSDTSAVEWVGVLPAGASDPVAQNADGTTTPLTMQDGVASIVEQAPATITYQINNQTASFNVQPSPSTCGAAATSCGHFVRVALLTQGGVLEPLPSGATSPAEATSPTGSSAASGTSGATSPTGSSGTSST